MQVKGQVNAKELHARTKSAIKEMQERIDCARQLEIAFQLMKLASGEGKFDIVLHKNDLNGFAIQELRALDYCVSIDNIDESVFISWEFPDAIS